MTPALEKFEELTDTSTQLSVSRTYAILCYDPDYELDEDEDDLAEALDYFLETFGNSEVFLLDLRNEIDAAEDLEINSANLKEGAILFLEKGISKGGAWYLWEHYLGAVTHDIRRLKRKFSSINSGDFQNDGWHGRCKGKDQKSYEVDTDYNGNVGSGAFFWSLLFGVFYFMYKGVWGHAVMWVIAALLTGGLSLFIYPFFAPGIIKKHYYEEALKN